MEQKTFTSLDKWKTDSATEHQQACEVFWEGFPERFKGMEGKKACLHIFQLAARLLPLSESNGPPPAATAHRTLLVAGGANLFQLSKTIACAFQFGDAPFDPHSQRGKVAKGLQWCTEEGAVLKAFKTLGAQKKVKTANLAQPAFHAKHFMSFGEHLIELRLMGAAPMKANGGEATLPRCVSGGGANYDLDELNRKFNAGRQGRARFIFAAGESQSEVNNTYTRAETRPLFQLDKPNKPLGECMEWNTLRYASLK